MRKKRIFLSVWLGTYKMTFVFTQNNGVKINLKS